MLTMDSNTILTPDEFFEREVALWGFDAIEGLLAQGWSIASNGRNGFKWVKDLTDASPCATMRSRRDRGVSGTFRRAVG